MAYLKIKHKAKAGYPAGKYHDAAAFRSVLRYVLDSEKTSSSLAKGVSVASDYENAVLQMETVSRLNAQDSGVRLRHMILSFEDRELARGRERSLHLANVIAYDVALYYANDYQIVYAVHTDGKDVHIHFVMNMVCYHTGLKYRGNRGDLYQFIEYINSVLARFGTSVYLLRDDEGI